MKKPVNHDKEHYNALIKHAKEHKLKVRCVSPKVLKDYAAMNPRAAKAMGFKRIKKNEILIDKSMPQHKKVKDLRHELIENDLMGKGKKYFPAHCIALKRENKMTAWEKEKKKK